MSDSEYLTINEAARSIPGRPHVATVWRWATHGVRGIKLRSIRSGNKVLTKPEWVEDFNAACNHSDAERDAAELVSDGC